MSIQYLSAEWFREATRALAESEPLRDAASTQTIAMTQVISDVPDSLDTHYVVDGIITYHLDIRDGQISFGPGPAENESIRFTEPYADAVALARGDVNAQELLMSGRLRFDGDHQALVDAAELFGLIETALTPIRDRTAYPASSSATTGPRTD